MVDKNGENINFVWRTGEGFWHKIENKRNEKINKYNNKFQTCEEVFLFSRHIGNGVSRVIMSNTQWCWTCRVVHDNKTNDNDLLVQVKSSKCTLVYFVLVPTKNTNETLYIHIVFKRVI